MKKFNVKDIILPAVALFVICLVASALLAVTNDITAEKIAQNLVETENSSRLIVMSEAKTFSEVTEKEDGLTVCQALDEKGEVLGYVYTSSAKGYGGAVNVMTGIGKDGEIKGIEIISHSETPGLGANSTKDSFKDRFKGKTGELVVDKNSNDGQNIQAITAATITSRAVVSAVNAAVADFEKTEGGAVNG